MFARIILSSNSLLVALDQQEQEFTRKTRGRAQTLSKVDCSVQLFLLIATTTQTTSRTLTPKGLHADYNLDSLMD